MFGLDLGLTVSGLGLTLGYSCVMQDGRSDGNEKVADAAA